MPLLSIARILLVREVLCCAWSIPVHCPGPWLHREERLLKILFLHKRFCKMQSHRQDPARSEAEFSPFQHPWVDGGRGARIWLLYYREAPLPATSRMLPVSAGRGHVSAGKTQLRHRRSPRLGRRMAARSDPGLALLFWLCPSLPAQELAELCMAGINVRGARGPSIPPVVAGMSGDPHISTHFCSFSAR